MKSFPFASALLATAVFASQAISAPDPNFHIYIAFGQSNMEGQAAVATADKTVNSRFKILASTTCSDPSRTNGSWSSAIPPLFNCSSVWGGSSGGYSLLDNFGDVMTAKLPNVTIGVIPVAVAGTAIDLFDKAKYSTYLSSAASYIQSRSNAYGGNPYQRIIDLGKAAKQVGVIKGILMHQGETDAYSSSWATEVKKVYNDMLTDLGLGADSVPLIVGEVLSPGQCSGANTQIDALPNTISTAHVVKSTGLSGQSDNLHFTHASYDSLGSRYAMMMIPLLKTNSGTTSSSSSAPTAASSSSAATPTSSAAANTPYKTHTIPGTIEAEDYDKGGQNVGFYDTDASNETTLYRTDNAGIDSASGAYVYGWVAAGEWLKYTLTVSQTAVYNYTVRVASASDNAGFTLYIDDFEIAKVTVPNTGDWKTFQEVSGTTTTVGAGSHVLKLSVDAAYFNVDWIKFEIPGTEKIAQGTLVSDETQTYTIYNLNGNKVATFRTAPTSVEASWNSARKNLPAGIYLLKRTNGTTRQLLNARSEK